MISKQKSSPQASFFFDLEDTLNKNHPLFILSNRIDWQLFEDAFAPLRKAHKQRAAIEPIIGHLKTDHRLGRNFYKGIIGDKINILLAAAAFNFKRMMNKWKVSICQFLNIIIFQIILVENQFSKN